MRYQTTSWNKRPAGWKNPATRPIGRTGTGGLDRFEIGRDWEHSYERCSEMHPEQDLIMKLRKWTVFVALALALVTACGDDNPGGNSGGNSGSDTETGSDYN